MACMCGDTHCGSCGPAQGNHRCYHCGEWMDDHAEHEGDPACKHDDERCQIAMQKEAEAEADDWLANMRDTDPAPGAP